MEHNILLVDDDPGLIRVMARMLAGSGQFRFATDGPAALRQAREWLPDLMVLDAEMPGMSGYQICDAMKSDPVLRDVPVIFVTSHTDHEFEVQALELGAADFLAKPVNEALLVARVKSQLRLKRLTDGLRQAASKDAVTKLHNRSSFDEQLEREWARALPTESAISLLVLEIDFMDLYAERYGHAQVDKTLRSVAKALQTVCDRPADLVARIDRNAFALLLPDTSLEKAGQIAQGAIEAVQGLAIVHDQSPLARHLTATVGMCAFDGRRAVGEPDAPVCDASDLRRCALAALGDARKGGAQAWLTDMVEGRPAVHARDLSPLKELKPVDALG